ncbi:radical SAM protein [Alicyclobacillus sp.]|uniref:SPL family radical SAM protein n=1 Tax=Alicyclobacillus sp. TaxID=61169 RepID=UPI0025BB7E3A|nr:radical SAM protein [Alicyclobacillus sp.]MCL6517642.1 radical SAM protein [Alicyclobacillus sp.]
MEAPHFQPITSKQVMNRVNHPGMPFRWSLNPYRGCAHGCSFCYARETHVFLGMEADDSFRTHILVKENAAEALEDQLLRMLRRHNGRLSALREEIGVLAIGTATDPYQPVEARAKRTRACLEVLARYRVPVSITTRSPLILRDLDLLREMDVQSIHLSVHTLDKDIWRRLEPATPHPLKRLETVQTLVENGLNAGIFLAPILPCLTDGTPALDAVIRAAAAHRARFAIPSVLRLTPDVKRWFFSVIAEHYPERLPALERLYERAYPPAAYVDPLMARIHRITARHGVSERVPRVAPRTETSREGIQLTLGL